MKKPTKAERHEIYKGVLENFEMLDYQGVCEKIAQQIFGICYYGNVHLITKSKFPELYLFRDVDRMYFLASTYNGWFDTQGSEIDKEFRKLVLMFCIEMTAPSVKDRAGILSERKIKVKACKNAKRKIK